MAENYSPIPFKRETTRQISISHQKRVIEGRTTFTDSRPLMAENYSPIPFKREGLSEQKKNAFVVAKPKVSIPFKREGLSEPLYQKFKILSETRFQFPSNGKPQGK